MEGFVCGCNQLSVQPALARLARSSAQGGGVLYAAISKPWRAGLRSGTCPWRTFKLRFRGLLKLLHPLDSKSFLHGTEAGYRKLSRSPKAARESAVGRANNVGWPARFFEENGEGCTFFKSSKETSPSRGPRVFPLCPRRHLVPRSDPVFHLPASPCRPPTPPWFPTRHPALSSSSPCLPPPKK